MDTVGSTEFGNWIINEIMKETLLSMPAQRPASVARLANLKIAEYLLVEFLQLKEKAMARALR